jgi:hypothetical protein
VNPHSDDWYNILIMFIDNIQITGTMYLECLLIKVRWLVQCTYSVNPHSDDWYNVLIVCEPTFRWLVQCTYSVWPHIQVTGTMYLYGVTPHSDDWYNVLIVCEPTYRWLVLCGFTHSKYIVPVIWMLSINTISTLYQSSQCGFTHYKCIVPVIWMWVHTQ